MTKIVKIKEIGNFSIFKNFHWDSNLSYQHKEKSEIYNFKDINIFYGRNYSGKTSLSKIIRGLETKKISSKYENPNFKVELDNEVIITQSNLITFNHPIHVYNSDFIKENLKFIHDNTQNVEAFSVTLGGDNQTILDRIRCLKNELGENEQDTETGIYLAIKKKKIENENAEKNYKMKVKNLDDLLATKATKSSDSIKNQHELFGDIRYDKRKLTDTDIPLVLNPTYQFLSDEQIQEYKNLINQKNLLEPPPIATYNLKFAELIQSTNSILKTIVGGSQKIEELVQNSDLNSWVQTGHNLHINRITCAFCSNQISEDRREKLRHHFDQETQKLQARISQGIQHLANLLGREDLKISFDIHHYYQQHHNELSTLKNDLHNYLSKQQSSIKQLISLLDKKNGQLFTELQTEYPKDYSEEIKITLARISQIRDSCIQFNSKLAIEQSNAKTALRLNHIYHFLQDINYTYLKAEIDLALKAIEPITQELSSLNTKKIEIENKIKNEEHKLKSEEEACIRINNILHHEFGHQNLSLKPIGVDTINGKVFNFEVRRNGNKAYNLSEGEQSLISFSYFLAKIQDDLDQDKKPIIWIDDPICSLDSNHIFFIFSLIEERICKNKKFLQLFISTHNLEFLKYLRRITGVENDRSIGSNKEENRKAGYYLIQRHDKFSSIRQMPLYLSKFLTEFNFLFEQIYKCATVTQIDDSNFHFFYNFGNNARKFLEIYTFYKFPSATYQLDSQLQTFWGDQIYKTLTDRIHNEYSHMTGVLERGETITDQPEMQKSAQAIINKIQSEDRKQYNALLESIGIRP